MRARVVMGWVEAPPEPEYEEEFAEGGEYAEGEFEAAPADGDDAAEPAAEPRED